MRSPERVRRVSLRTRVAVAAGLLAMLVGLVAAGVAALLVEELEVAVQDERLMEVASLMHREFDVEGGDPRRHVEDEAAEIAPMGLRISLFEHGVRTSGAPEVPYADEEGCSARNTTTGRWRMCALGGRAQRIVVSTHREAQKSRRGILLLSVGGASLLAAFVSALVSRALAGWALAPLTALGERIERITDAAPGEADLGEPGAAPEVEALRATIRDLLRRLGEAIERSRGFAASAAHELRTPLATMIAELELATEESPDVSASLQRVRRTAGRLSVLVEQLLMIADESANVRVTEAVAMEDVVRDVLAGRTDAERARLEPLFTTSGMVRGDETLLRVVVENLVDNALKFSEHGAVHVIVGDEGGEVQLTVRDEGSGIDASEADRLLRPFARGREASVPGHGLGLSIVAHAVRLHGGRVRIVPRTVGAELRVTLPAWSTSDA